MTGIYPNAGVPAADARNTVVTSNVPGCTALFYSTTRCQPRFDPVAQNALLSEALNLISCAGLDYDCSRLDNLCLAVKALIAGSQAPVLTENRDIYVSKLGSDVTGDGTFVKPFLTIQKGVNVVGKLSLNGFTATVHVGDGTYAESVQLTAVSTNGTAVLVGNDGAFANCFINPPSGSAIVTAQAGSNWTVHGFKVVGIATAGDTGNGLFVTATGRSISYYNMEFGICAGYHIAVAGGQALLMTAGTIRISGGAIAHALAYSGGVWTNGGVTASQFTLIGTPAFSTAFVIAFSNANIFVLMTVLAGTATGPRYLATSNGTINSFGNGATYFPGSVAGSTSSGGQYY